MVDLIDHGLDPFGGGAAFERNGLHGVQDVGLEQADFTDVGEGAEGEDYLRHVF